jgi:hypothetical protein
MTGRRKIAIWVLVAVGVIVVAALVRQRTHRRAETPLAIVGTVIKQDADTRKESPIADVEISAPPEFAITNTRSDFSGYFKLNLPQGTDPGETIPLQFSHPDYKPTDMKVVVNNQLYIVPMIPLHGEIETELSGPAMSVANVVIRYTIAITTTENIGAGATTFQVVNTGNVPCYQHFPCSPDNQWKATIGTATMDAGEGNVFQDARLTCIAGPCPFTKIESDDYTRPTRVIKVAVRDWSNTTTFLLQAEVFHTRVGDIVRKSFPVILGRSLNFTVPGDAEGVTMEAELSGAQIIFPLAPNPSLSWADCNVKVEENRAKDYRCELKPGFQFK